MAFLVLTPPPRTPLSLSESKSAAATSQVHGEDYFVPAATPETDVTTATGPPGTALTIQSKEGFQMGGPDLEGTLKVTGAKAAFLLPRGDLAESGAVVTGLTLQAARKFPQHRLYIQRLVKTFTRVYICAACTYFTS